MEAGTLPKNMVLNTEFCLKIILRHTYLFLIFGWGEPSQLRSWSEGCVEPLKLCREAIGQVSEDPYHKEFVSWRVDHFFLLHFFPLPLFLEFDFKWK